MKPIDDPRFAEAVHLFEQEYASQADIDKSMRLRQRGLAAKPSPQTHYRTMAKLRCDVRTRLFLSEPRQDN